MPFWFFTFDKAFSPPTLYSQEGMTLCRLLLVFIFALAIGSLIAQDPQAKDSLAVNKSTQQDTLSKFDSFNKKAERFFKVAPVPIVAYSTEAGNIFGLAKFNTFHL